MADASNASPPETAATAALEVARARCAALRDRVSGTLPSFKISDSCRGTLLRLLGAELCFLSHLSPSDVSPPFSLNVGYLESIVHIIEQPSVTRVSRICKSVVPPPPRASSSQHPWKPVQVDIVCTLCQRPAWFLVSDRNPKYISWLGSRRGNGAGLRARVERVVSAAHSASISLKPESVVIFFAKGVGDAISDKLVGEFGASEMENQFSCPDFYTFQELEGGWVNVIGPVSRAFEIKIVTERYSGETLVKLVEQDYTENKKNDLTSSNELYRLLSRLRQSSNKELINFDTTTLIALVSGISNGGAGRLFKADEVDMRKRFKGNYDFVVAQAISELQIPILAELNNAIDGRKGIVCESSLSEFKDIVTMCGGASEKARAEQLLQCLVVVPDNPSARITGLPTTRKIAMKNKFIFGTGDHWHAPTLTANIGFVRAISQTGMSLLTIEHRPRALIGYLLTRSKTKGALHSPAELGLPHSDVTDGPPTKYLEDETHQGAIRPVYLSPTIDS